MASSRKITEALMRASTRETEPLLAVSRKSTSYFDLLPIECFYSIEKKLDIKSFFSLASTSKAVANKMGLNGKQSKFILSNFIPTNKKYHSIEQQYKYTLLGNAGRIIFGISIIGLALVLEVLICLEGGELNNAMKMDENDYFRSAIYVVGSFVCAMIGLGGIACLLYVKKVALLSESRSLAENKNRTLWQITLDGFINPEGYPSRLAKFNDDQKFDLMERGLWSQNNR